MKKFSRILVFVLGILCPLYINGQESLFPYSLKYPPYEYFADKHIDTYVNKSKELLYTGDLEGLEDNIEILNDLNLQGDPSVRGRIMNNQGILEYYQGNLSEAIQYFLRAAAYYEQSNYNHGINTLMNNISLIFAEIEDYESCKKYLKKALDYTPDNDLTSRSVYLLNLAEVEERTDNCRTAINISLELLDIYNPRLFDFSEIAIYGIIISCYNTLKEDEEAIKWIKKGDNIPVSDSAYLDIQSYNKSVADFYFQRSEYEKVIEYGQKVYPPPDESYLHELYKTINQMAIAARHTGRIDLAMKLNRRANELEFNREPFSRSDIISSLMYDYSYNRDNLDRELISKELQENNIREEIQSNFFKKLIVISFILLIIIIVLIYTRRAGLRYRINLESNNRKIEEINKQLRLSNKDLEKENRTLDTLISVFAHDLINPFQAILGFTQIMINDYDKLDKHDIIEYTGILSETSLNLNQLLLTLKGLAIINDESGNFKANKFTLVSALKNIKKLFRTSLNNKDINIKMDNCIDAEINYNRDVFDAVIRNVISNAIKFSEKGSTIIISNQLKNNKMKISITDNGIGMSDSTREMLLNRNYLESRSGTLNEKGSGIGLAISIDLLDTAGGNLDIISEEGKGTTVVIEINLPEA